MSRREGDAGKRVVDNDGFTQVNMVDTDADCTIASSLISSQERDVWKEILDKLHCNDLWNCIGGHTIRFTFHSRSHKKAMSRLDRCYYSHTQNLDATSTMWIDATMLLSDHNPLLIDLREPQWNSCIPHKLYRIPLRLNHAWLKTSMFKSEVRNLIQYVLSLKISACMKWEVFVIGMQDLIRDCGKYFSNVINSAKSEAQKIILFMTEKIDIGQLLSNTEYSRLCDAYTCLQLIENNAIQSAKIRERCAEVIVGQVRSVRQVRYVIVPCQVRTNHEVRIRTILVRIFFFSSFHVHGSVHI
ncbi:hypothetical protein KP509_11G005100 [Ceratopteris richardii]|uniref:Uncharacterized protein n=1 Tax=Ceratopteris richardii TaxID=49495 RepID=A0A8T2TSG9_CERRI|nr:hypothetical protein KP509_11G005100 [Ceratopteris richardii]